jgi:hypothetical protein
MRYLRSLQLQPSRTGSLATAFSYLRMGHFYVNSRLGPLRLLRNLWHQLDQFLGSEGKTRLVPTRLSRPFPPAVWKAVRVTRIVGRYLLARALNRSESSAGSGGAIVLPVNGEFAIIRKSGAIKVLDTSKHTVYTVMGPDGRDKLRERVELSKQASRFPFAPEVKEVDSTEGYFAEEFVRGSHPLNFEGCGEDFTEVYRPLLVEFLRAVRPRWRPLPDYVDSLRNEILARDGLLMRLEPSARRRVASFVEKTCGRLSELAIDLPLVLSHGDYFSGNVVIDGSRHRAIDWANMGFRSPLHDLYYLQMNHCRRALDHRALVRRSRVAIDELREALRNEDNELFMELASALSATAEYRWLFYLECIHVPLVRCTNPEDRYLASMLVRVSWFAEYERALAGENVADPAISTPVRPAKLKPSGTGNC